MNERGSWRIAKLIGLIFAGPVIFLASLPWLDRQPDWVVHSATAAMAVWAVAASVFVTARLDRAADEWERSGSRFSYLWGGVTGSGLVALLLALPPFHRLLVGMAAWFQGAPAAEIDRTTVIVVFTAGFATVVLAQVLCAMLFLLAWRRWTLGGHG